MNGSERVRLQAAVVLGRIQTLIRLLHAVPAGPLRSLLLNDLWHQVSSLQHLMKVPSQADLPTVTREELAAATGRGGKPAYVAVNGVVYDVTNHRGWSLGTHFGLAAGRDLTTEFNSCHAGQQWILGTLRPVGRLS